MNKELKFVKGMFDKIAPMYDFLNRLLSLRQDVSWRAQMVKATRLRENSRVLDAACGTCDVSLEILKQTKNQVKIAGMDFSSNMIKFAKKKTACSNNINLIKGDALALPFDNNQFDAVFIAFGIRNIMDRSKALYQFRQILKQDGSLAVLELTIPEKGIMKEFYLFYFQKILPLIGAFLSKDSHAYSYLTTSVSKFPQPRKFANIIKNAGFHNVKFRPMAFGIATLFLAKK